MVSPKLENYLTLLSIRRVGRRRDFLLTGGIFLVSFIAIIALGMLDRLAGRSLYLVSALVVVFGFNFLIAWVRLEIVKETIELINNFETKPEYG